jgi:hypothetical protein
MNNIKLYKNGELVATVRATQVPWKQHGTSRKKHYPKEVYEQAHKMGYTRKNGKAF